MTVAASTFTPIQRIEFLRVLRNVRFLCDTLRENAKRPPNERKVVGGVLLGYGNEHISVGSALALDPARDWVAPSHRDQGTYVVRGISAFEIFKQHLCKETSLMGGRDGNMHMGDRSRRIVPFISDMMAQAPICAGIAEAERFLKKDSADPPGIAAVYFGDGAFSQGVAYETMNWVAIKKLPLLFICINNGYAISTPVEEQSAVADLAIRARGCGIEAAVSETLDVEEVYMLTSRVVREMREHPVPYFLEFKCRRLSGHNENEIVNYIPKETLAQWQYENDPVAYYTERLQKEHCLTEDDLRAMDELLKSEIGAAWESALAEPDPLPIQRRRFPMIGSVPSKAHRVLSLPHEGHAALDVPQPAEGREIPFWKAINEALMQELESDPTVCVFGEDVASPKGGVFGITQRLSEKFGKDRVFNTTLAEALIVGLMNGEAFAGRRPVAEIQFAPFVFESLAQLFNVSGTFYYRNKIALPSVLRLPHGGGFSGGPFHSECIEGLFFHWGAFPIAYPSTAYDAKGLLASAIRDNNIVLFFEEIWAYTRVKDIVPKEPYALPFGKAAVRHAGADVTLVTYGPLMLAMALAAARALEKEGVGLEVIDLRSFFGNEAEPFDVRTCTQSLKKTGRLIVLSQSKIFGGVVSEICASLAETCAAHLRGGIPIRRLAAFNAPVPYHPNLERSRLPSTEEIVWHAHDLLRS